MAVELAQEVALATRMQRLNKRGDTLVHVERRQKPLDPLPVISAENYSSESKRIEKVNFFLAGAYGLSLAYDQLCKGVFESIKKSGKKKKSSLYALPDFIRDTDTVTEYSLNLSQALGGYLNGETEQTQEAEEAVAAKTNDIFTRVLPTPLPPQQEKKVDAHMGIDRFLQSEVLELNINVHNIRTPLTIFKGRSQLLLRNGTTELGEDLLALIKQRQDNGKHLRKVLLAPLPVHSQRARQIIDSLEQFVTSSSTKEQFASWNILLPESVPANFPTVMFNEYMLHSIVENAFFNAQKGRKLLEEYFSKLLATPFLAGETPQAKNRALRYLEPVHQRLEQPPSISMDLMPVTLRRKPYAEIVLRDNGIGNEYRSRRKQWRRNFSIGASDWYGSQEIDGTGIAMGTHRQRIKELFPHTYADLFLRNRTDQQQGAELVIRLPVSH